MSPKNANKQCCQIGTTSESSKRCYVLNCSRAQRLSFTSLDDLIQYYKKPNPHIPWVLRILRGRSGGLLHSLGDAQVTLRLPALFAVEVPAPPTRPAFRRLVSAGITLSCSGCGFLTILYATTALTQRFRPYMATDTFLRASSLDNTGP